MYICIWRHVNGYVLMFMCMCRCACARVCAWRVYGVYGAWCMMYMVYIVYMVCIMYYVVCIVCNDDLQHPCFKTCLKNIFSTLMFSSSCVGVDLSFYDCAKYNVLKHFAL